MFVCINQSSATILLLQKFALFSDHYLNLRSLSIGPKKKFRIFKEMQKVGAIGTKKQREKIKTYSLEAKLTVLNIKSSF